VNLPKSFVWSHPHGTLVTIDRKEVSMKKNDIRFSEPLYTVAEAARVIDVPASTLATWTKGYVRDRDD
jgi:hypothetical protein